MIMMCTYTAVLEVHIINTERKLCRLVLKI